ncbi:MAG: hypothetical protein SFX18_20030 [Pirellulales bacterium]|nr:hypothetical protein [Pirellulales bacterium]
MKITHAVFTVMFMCLANLVLAAEPPKLPAQLQALEPLVGTWKVESFVSKKAEWSPAEVRSQGDVATTRWIMDGWFLEDRKAPGSGSEHLGIWHYDQSEQAFHYTMFQSPGGNRTDITIHWNDKSQAFEGVATMPQGVSMRTITRFPDKDTKEWRVLATDAAGKVYLDISCQEKRVPAEDSQPKSK